MDINRLLELAYIDETEFSLRIGALTRQAALERDRGSGQVITRTRMQLWITFTS